MGDRLVTGLSHMGAELHFDVHHLVQCAACEGEQGGCWFTLFPFTFKTFSKSKRATVHFYCCVFVTILNRNVNQDLHGGHGHGGMCIFRHLIIASVDVCRNLQWQLSGCFLSKVPYSNSYWHSCTDWQWLQCKVLTSTPGAVWGSESCPRTVWHTYNWTELNRWPSDSKTLSHSHCHILQMYKLMSCEIKW